MQNNPKIAMKIQEQIRREKERANILYVDFVIDGTSSMSTLYPAVYLTAKKIVEWLQKYEVLPLLGITVIRSLEAGEENESVLMEDGDSFTSDFYFFLRKLRRIKIYGGDDGGEESIREAIYTALKKFPKDSTRAVLIFTDSYGSKNYAVDLSEEEVGAVVFFCTEELSREVFEFSFVGRNHEIDEEGSPLFVDIEDILGQLDYTQYENIVKPLKDLVKGVSIGA